MQTEARNPLSENIDLMTTENILKVINDEDKKVPYAVERALPQVSLFVELCVDTIKTGGRLVYVGAGTSGRLGVLDAAECPPTYGTSESVIIALIAGGNTALRRAVEGAEDDENSAVTDLKSISFSSKDVLLALSASGRTPYAISAVKYAKKMGSKTGCVCCNANAPLASIVDIPIVVEVGPEVIAGSTRMKAGTAQKLVLNMISTAIMIKLGRVYKNYMVEVQPVTSKTKTRAVKMVSEICGVNEELALSALTKSNFDVKAAIVMCRLGVDEKEAKRILDLHERNLRRVFGEYA
jgi:N-acetylmuramic acid 6-phosphate etherase